VLDQRRLRQLFTLQGEAGELHPLTDACRQHVLRRAAELLDAAAGCLILSGDGTPDGEGRVVDAVTYNFDGVTRPAFQPLLDLGCTFHPVVNEMMRVHANETAVEVSHEIISRRAWYESPYYCDHVRQIGFDESIVSTHATGRRYITQGFGFFRERGQRQFTDDDKLLLQLIEFGLGGYVHRPLDSLHDDARLSPRERDVLRLLLEGLSDKEIAARLAISRHTVNQRTKRVFTIFGVHSRIELLARYLRRPTTDR
jgi:DNA-binding CsgD family transcriptional regulator